MPIKNRQIPLSKTDSVTSIYIISNGCHESLFDARLLELYLNESPAFNAVEKIQDADIIILLGCSVSQNKEEQTCELMKIISEQKRPDARILVSGCIEKIRPELQANDKESNILRQEIYNILKFKSKPKESNTHFSYSAFANDQQGLINITRNHMRQNTVREYAINCTVLLRPVIQMLSGTIVNIANKYTDYIESKTDIWNGETYTIKISTGCCGDCAYCSIKQSRGNILSRPIEDIVNDFKAGLSQGYVDFALIGTDTGDYGKDLGTDLLDLLDALVNLPGRFLLRLRNVNPRWIISSVSQFCHLLKSRKISYIQSPIQSCSNHILNLMNRGYNAEDFFDAMEKIRHTDPDIFIKTQIIVGFPCESDADFQESYKLYESRLFNYVDVFRYSNRPNTRASNMTGQISQEIIMRRYKKLIFKSLLQLGSKHLLRRTKNHS